MARLASVTVNPTTKKFRKAQAPFKPFQFAPLKDIKYGNKPWEVFDLYKASPGGGKLVIWLHGGGGTVGSENFNQADFPWENFLSRGLDIAAVRYGLVGTFYPGYPNGAAWPEHQSSVAKATRKLRNQYGYDHITVWGNSWGGMIGGLVGLDDSYPAVERMDAWVAWGVPTDPTLDVVDATFKGTLPTYVDPVTYPKIPGGYLHSVLSTPQLEAASCIDVAAASGLHVPTYFSYYEPVQTAGSVTTPHAGVFGTLMQTQLATNGETNLELQQELGIANFDADTIADWVAAL